MINEFTEYNRQLHYGLIVAVGIMPNENVLPSILDGNTLVHEFFVPYSYLIKSMEALRKINAPIMFGGIQHGRHSRQVGHTAHIFTIY